MTPLRILAPAKINLGLAVLGKRADGYHNIDTIMAKIDLADEITITPNPGQGIHIAGMHHVPVEDNLMTRAAWNWSHTAGIPADWTIEIHKRIPSSAGLGGGSSDAASVLMALNRASSSPLTNKQLHIIATGIGSDCPFFLGNSCARALGTGTTLTPLRAPTGWLVLAIPDIRIPAKTASMYGALVQDDYGSRATIDAVAKQLNAGARIQNSLPNSFSRAAMQIFPGLIELHRLMRDIAGNCSISGAGPTLYAVTSSESEAQSIASQCQDQSPQDVSVIVSRFLA